MVQKDATAVGEPALQGGPAGPPFSAWGRRSLGLGLATASLTLALVYVLLPWGEACQSCYMDFWHFLSAAHALRAGENPYDIEAVQAYWVGVTPLAFYWIAYPPYFLAALQPLTWMNPRMAERVWTLFNLATLTGLSVLLVQLLRLRMTPARVGLALLLTLSYFPTVAVLHLGQLTAFLVALTFLAWWLLQRGRPLAAGFALALLTLKPPWLITPLVYLAVRREWRALGAFGVGTAVLLSPGWSFLGSWISSVGELTAVQQARVWANPSPLDLMKHLDWGTPGLRVAVAGAMSLSLLGGFAVLARRTGGKSGEPFSPREDQVLALGWVLLPLMLPQFRAYDLMVLVGPLLVFGRIHWDRPGWAARIGLALLALAWGWPYLQLLVGSLDLGLYNYWVWYLISPLALFASALLALRRTWRGPADRSSGAASATASAPN